MNLNYFIKHISGIKLHTIFFLYLHLSLYIWFTDYFNLDHMYPFSQPHLLSLVQSKTSQDLSSPTVSICPPPAHHPTIWLFVSLIILLKPATKTSRSFSSMNMFQLFDFSAALMQWTTRCRKAPDRFWRLWLTPFLCELVFPSWPLTSWVPQGTAYVHSSRLAHVPQRSHACLCFQW